MRARSYLVARKAYRTGVQTLSVKDGQWYISIRNRTYASRVEISHEEAQRWLAALMNPGDLNDRAHRW
jgi:hypothetical protein